MSRLVSFGIPLAALGLSGCADAVGGSYVLDRGPANYDTLRAATEACQGRGGTLRPRDHYDGQDLSGFECVIGKAR